MYSTEHPIFTARLPYEGWVREEAGCKRWALNDYYVLRPPFAQERLRLRADGHVVLELKMPWHDGTRYLVFEPLEFLEKLAAIIPRPEVM